MEIDEFIRDVLTEALKAGLDESVRRGLYMLQRVAIAQLKKNVPPEAQIWGLHLQEGDTPVKHDSDTELQWDHMSTAYTGLAALLGRQAVEAGHSDVARTALATLGQILREMLQLPLGDRQKERVLGLCLWEAEDLILRQARRGLHDEISLGLSPFDSFLLDAVLATGKDYSKQTLIVAARVVVELMKLGVLKRFDLNWLGTVGRGCVQNVEKPLYKEALIFIIGVFDALRKLTGGRADEASKRLYLEVYGQVSSFKRWMETQKKTDAEIESTLEEALAKFERLESIRHELESGALKWPSPS